MKKSTALTFHINGIEEESYKNPPHMARGIFVDIIKFSNTISVV